MTVIPKMAVPGTLLGNSVATVGTVPSGKRWKITAATSTNNDASARLLTVHLVPDGGSVGNDTLLLDALSIAVDEGKVLSALIGHSLEPGMTIRAMGSTANSLNLMVSVLEVPE